MKKTITPFVCGLVSASLFVWLTVAGFAQGTGFTYQSRLTESNLPANGSYDFQFKLYDALAGGAQIGATNSLTNVPVSSGVFAVTLDFGATAFPGANRWLEISVRLAGGGAFTTLMPRRAITATPYAVKSLSATAADGLSATCAGCIVDAQIAAVAGSKVTGTIPVGSVPDLGASYIKNATEVQASTNFNISGNGTAGGTLLGNTVNTATHFSISGVRVFSAPGTENLFAGAGAGNANTDGYQNSFFGRSAGNGNTSGFNNSFFGQNAGKDNNSGNNNSFFGRAAGQTNTIGNSNSFFGSGAGSANTSGGSNSFFGSGAGNVNSTGLRNSFFGSSAGASNKAAISNSFFGYNAGLANTDGNNNSFFGDSAGVLNTTGSNNAFFGIVAGRANVVGINNSFFGVEAGTNNIADRNSFFGFRAGALNTSGGLNTFIGHAAGGANTIGSNNTILGAGANLGANELAFATAIGSNSQVSCSNCLVLGGVNGVNGGGNTNVGIGTTTPSARLDVVGTINTTAQYNIDERNRRDGGRRILGVGPSNDLFVGINAGAANPTGGNNTFVGTSAGTATTSGGNVFVGTGAGKLNVDGNRNTTIGFNAQVNGPGLTNATAIGADAQVDCANCLVLGSISAVSGNDTNVGIGLTSPSAKLHVNGIVRVDVLGTAGPPGSLCRNASNQLSTCSSSLRYKDQITPLKLGLGLVNRLRPVTFNWKADNQPDLGLVAEEVAAIEPLLVTHNDKGEIEGVKYAQLNVVLINAIKQQQEQIKQQQAEIESLKKLVCLSHPNADFCKSGNAENK